jgi:two-component system response regulator DevR
LIDLNDPADDKNSADPAIRVFLLDDHEVVRRGVADLVDAESDMAVVGQSASSAEALSEVKRCRPNVAVLDVRLADGNGISVCRDIRSAYPDVACLILTSFDDDRAIVDAAMAGAAGFVLKQIRSNDLIDSIRKVAGGAQLLDNAATRMAIDRLRSSEDGILDSLTEQERRVFDLIGEGFSNRQIADELFLAEKTVKNYVSNMFAKLGIVRRTEAAALAARIEERSRLRYD